MVCFSALVENLELGIFEIEYANDAIHTCDITYITYIYIYIYNMCNGNEYIYIYIISVIVDEAVITKNQQGWEYTEYTTNNRKIPYGNPPSMLWSFDITMEPHHFCITVNNLT